MSTQGVKVRTLYLFFAFMSGYLIKTNFYSLINSKFYFGPTQLKNVKFVLFSKFQTPSSITWKNTDDIQGN